MPSFFFDEFHNAFPFLESMKIYWKFVNAFGNKMNVFGQEELLQKILQSNLLTFLKVTWPNPSGTLTILGLFAFTHH